MAGSFAYDIDFPLIGNHGGPDTPSSPPSSPPGPAYTSGSSLSASPTLPSTGAYGIQLPPHPETPREWIWRCHLCKTRYNLATTRRCLTDGHYYCYGKGAGKNIKPKLRGKPCPSVFDYSGWEDWNDWRKRVQQIRFLWDEAEGPPAPPTERNCVENCYFPSACRYLETVQDMYMFDPSHMDASNLRTELATDARRKRLFDNTEGVSHPIPAKMPKLQHGPKPEHGPEIGPEPEPQPKPRGEGRNHGEPQQEVLPPQDTPTSQPTIPGLPLATAQRMLFLKIRAPRDFLRQLAPNAGSSSTEEELLEEEYFTCREYPSSDEEGS